MNPLLCHVSSLSFHSSVMSAHYHTMSVISAPCVWNLFRIPCHTIYLSCQLHVCGTCSGFHVTPYICHVSSMCVALVQDPMSHHISVMSAPCVWHLFRIPCHTIYLSCQLRVCGTCSGSHVTPYICHVSSMCVALVQDPMSHHISVMSAPCVWHLFRIPCHTIYLSCQLRVCGTCSGSHVTPYICHVSSVCVALVQDPMSHHISVMSAPCVWHLFRIPCHTIYLSCQLRVCGTCSGSHVTPYICHVSSVCVALVQDPMSHHISVMSAPCVWHLFRIPCHTIYLSCQLRVCGTCSGSHVTPYICHVSSVCVALVQDPMSHHISVMSAPCVWHLFRIPCHTIYLSCQLRVCGTCSGIHVTPYICHVSSVCVALVQESMSHHISVMSAPCVWHLFRIPCHTIYLSCQLHVCGTCSGSHVTPYICHVSSMCVALVQDPMSHHISVMSAPCVWHLFRIPCHTIYLSCQLCVCGTCSGSHVTPYICHVSSVCVALVQDPMSHHISVMSAPCVWHLFRIPCHTIYLSCQLRVCGTCSGSHVTPYICHVSSMCVALVQDPMSHHISVMSAPCVALVQDPMSHHISVMSAPCVWHLFRIPCHTIYLSCQLRVCGTCSGSHVTPYICHVSSVCVALVQDPMSHHISVMSAPCVWHLFRNPYQSLSFSFYIFSGFCHVSSVCVALVQESIPVSVIQFLYSLVFVMSAPCVWHLFRNPYQSLSFSFYILWFLSCQLHVCGTCSGIHTSLCHSVFIFSGFCHVSSVCVALVQESIPVSVIQFLYSLVFVMSAPCVWHLFRNPYQSLSFSFYILWFLSCQLRVCGTCSGIHTSLCHSVFIFSGFCHVSSMCVALVQESIPVSVIQFLYSLVFVMSAPCVWHLFRNPYQSLSFSFYILWFLSCQLRVCGTCSGIHTSLCHSVFIFSGFCHVSSVCVALVQESIPVSVIQFLYSLVFVMSAPCVWHLFRNPYQSLSFSFYILWFLSCQLRVCGTCSGIHTSLCHSVFIFSGFCPIELLCLWRFYGAVACSCYTDSIMAMYKNVQWGSSLQLLYRQYNGNV